jgi:hypothetical protein
MGTFCPMVESGSGVQVTFAVGLADVAAECATDSRQLSAIVGGTWQEAKQEDFSLPLVCAVLYQGSPVVVRDSDGSAQGEGVCHELIAAGWSAEPSNEQSMPVVFSAAS